MDNAIVQERFDYLGVGISAEYLTEWTRLAAVALAQAINTDTYEEIYAFFIPELVKRIIRIDQNKTYNLGAYSQNGIIDLHYLSSDTVSVKEDMTAHCVVALWTSENNTPKMWLRERWIITLPTAKPQTQQCANCGAKADAFAAYCKYCRTYYQTEGQLLVISSTST